MAEVATGSGTAQAELWGQNARDWADVMEGWNGWGVPVYRHVLERVPVDSGTTVLDVGCGAGRFCRIAADRGARVYGLDATSTFVEIARSRVLEADFRVGDMEHLPWGDDSFDVVTGFNSFFIAADMVCALAEASRVARPGGHVALSVFGRPERCDSTEMFKAVAGLQPQTTGSGNGDPGPQLHDEGVLEELAERAGLAPREAGFLQFEERYPDLETLLRGVMAAPPMVRAVQAAGSQAVREVLTDAFRKAETADGTYVLEEEARYLIATA